MDHLETASQQTREWQFPVHTDNRQNQLLNNLLSILSFTLLMVGMLVIIAPVWQPGYPRGSDSWGHLQRALDMGTAIREHGLLEGFSASAWMPDWYLGDPTRVYYPPLMVWILGPLTALVGDVFLAYRFYVTALFLTLGISIYLVGIRWGRSHWLAALGALLAVMTPYTLRTVFAEGNLPRGLALLALPWLLWHTEVALTQKRTERVFVFLALLWAFALVAHVMQAVMFGLAIGLYVVVRHFADASIPLRRGVLALAPFGIGLLLAAFYLLPAYSHAELANVPSLPEDKIELFSISPTALLPYHADFGDISIGLIGAALALLVTIKVAKDYQWAMLVSGAVCILLAFGPAGGLFQLVPLHQSLLPHRFLNATAIIFPLLIATTPPNSFKARWLIVALVVIGWVEFMPAWRAVPMREAPQSELAIATALEQGKMDGRVAPLIAPEPTSSLIFLTSVKGQHESTSGWALENTPHQDAIRRLLRATTRSPEYLQRVLSLWNVDYLVTRFENGTDSLTSVLTYQPMAEAGALQLWERATPSTFAQVLPDNRMLIIGNNATSWLFAFPFATEGEYADPADYSPEYLEHFSVIGLNRLPDNADVEAALGEWVSRGNTLIVDLSGTANIRNQGFTLFGVHAFRQSLEEGLSFNWSPELEALQSIEPFSLSNGGWGGATYENLDQTLATVSSQQQEYPLLGYRNVGSGRVWFVGFNLLYWLDISGQHEASTVLTDMLLAGTGVNRDLTLPSQDIEWLERNSNRLSFSYSSDAPINGILSMTYFPRWQASVDGEAVSLQSHEHLMLLALPVGTHTVTLTYHPYSSISLAGMALSLITVIILGCLYFIMKWRPLLAREDQEDKVGDWLMP